MTMQSWTNDQIAEQIKKVGENAPQSVDAVDKISENKHRDLLVVGCGDGGAMIAQEIRKAVPNTVAICYNTSAANMDKVRVDVKIIPKAEDGSGKVRDYSKDVFKQGSYKNLLGNVEAMIKSNPNIEYVIVCTTTDGGTGSGVSPMVAKLLSQNIEVPVIIVGVYPMLAEDAIAQYNTMMWQTEVEKTGLPYMIFDNEVSNIRNKAMIHNIVNTEIAGCMQIIAGDVYGPSPITTIDTKDMYMMLIHTGKRIMLASSDRALKSDQTLDNYVMNMLADCNQPMPSSASAIGVFLKGPTNVISKLDTSLTEIRKTYGDATLQYTHIEESEDTRISIIFSGCNEPVERLYQIRGRYDDIMNAQKTKESIMSDLTCDLRSPVGTVVKTKLDNAEPDLSALDL